MLPAVRLVTARVVAALWALTWLLLPGMGLVGLILAPYTDRNPSNKPEDRKFAISLFTIFLMSCAVLTIIGSFFRGPGQLLVFPWAAGLFFEL